MPDDASPLVHLRAVTKDYRSLRPLRIRDLAVHQGESVALVGLDDAMAGVLVDLLTAGSVPDTGDVIVFGEPTTAITTREAWLSMLDRFGLISERGLLLDTLTAEQNLAMPISLVIESMSDELRRSVRRLADEVRLPADQLATPFGQLPAASKLRVRLGRALALEPQMLLSEHPNAGLGSEEARTFARDVVSIARRRNMATLTCTADKSFAHEIAERVLTLRPATGELTPMPAWRRWF